MFNEFYKWRVEHDVDNAIWVSHFHSRKINFQNFLYSKRGMITGITRLIMKGALSILKDQAKLLLMISLNKRMKIGCEFTIPLNMKNSFTGDFQLAQTLLGIE